MSFILSLPKASAQNGLLLQWEPEFSYTWELANRWSANTKAAFQQSLSPPTETEPQRQYQFNHMQVQFFATYSVWTNLKLSGGYTFRINDPTETLGSHNHRLMQQLAFVSYLRGQRFANRFRLEQRFRDEGYINRWRYRISFDVPLNGENVDPGEKYLVASDEWLFSFNNQGHESQNRLYLGIGWYANSQRKIEAGFQYRLDGIGTGTLDNTLWFTTAFYWNQ